ncbi:hypothetical protein ACTXT7_006386 [Hymenolepis weldensis]
MRTMQQQRDASIESSRKYQNQKGIDLISKYKDKYQNLNKVISESVIQNYAHMVKAIPKAATQIGQKHLKVKETRRATKVLNAEPQEQELREW